MVQVEIGRIPDGRKSGELKNEITKSKKDEGEPDPFEARDATKTVAERPPDRIKKHQQRISAAEPKQRIYSREAREHEGEYLSNESVPNVD